jgi:hypothetical protein
MRTVSRWYLAANYRAVGRGGSVPADRYGGSPSYGPCHEKYRQPGGIRALGTPLARRPWLGHLIDPEAVGAQHVDVGRKRAMVGAHLPAETGERSVGRPPAFIVIAAGGRPGSGDVLTPGKTWMQNGKDEPSHWQEQSRDCRKRAIEVVDVREAEAGDDRSR